MSRTTRTAARRGRAAPAPPSPDPRTRSTRHEPREPDNAGERSPADARSLPLAEDSVDLVVTSPPYYGLRSYQDGGQPYEGQIGAESTPAEYLDALLDVTRECVRVLKPTGSIWVNLGDRYSTGNSGHSALAKLGERYRGGGHADARAKRASRRVAGRPAKSLLGFRGATRSDAWTSWG
jgi:hypothetical protein